MAWPPEGVKLKTSVRKKDGVVEIRNEVSDEVLLTVRGYKGTKPQDFLAWIVSLQTDLSSSRAAAEAAPAETLKQANERLAEEIRQAQDAEKDIKENEPLRAFDEVMDEFGKKAGAALDSVTGQINGALGTFEAKLKKSRFGKLLGS